MIRDALRIAVVAGVGAVLIVWWHQLDDAARWFCLEGEGYQFWSGIGSGSPLLAAIVVFVRRRNCHVTGCWRLGYIDPAIGYPACRRHHSCSHKIGVAPE